MSEEQQKPKSFMEELALWSEANIIGPLSMTDPNQADWNRTVEQVKQALRSKVLESYRNGQAAGPTKPRSSGFIPRGHQPALNN